MIKSQREQEELLELSQALLVAIGSQNWERYVELCDPSLSAFEPEAMGHLVDGLDFHHFYFRLPPKAGEMENPPMQSTMVAPHIRIMGDVAIVAYVRLTQKLVDGHPRTISMEETRVWQRIEGEWKHVHFHRSRPTTA